jgi:hypothetical protein
MRKEFIKNLTAENANSPELKNLLKAVTMIRRAETGDFGFIGDVGIYSKVKEQARKSREVAALDPQVLPTLTILEPAATAEKEGSVQGTVQEQIKRALDDAADQEDSDWDEPSVGPDVAPEKEDIISDCESEYDDGGVVDSEDESRATYSPWNLHLESSLGTFSEQPQTDDDDDDDVDRPQTATRGKRVVELKETESDSDEEEDEDSEFDEIIANANAKAEKKKKKKKPRR